MKQSSGVARTACDITDIEVDGRRGPGRPKMTWKKLTESGWKLTTVNPHVRNARRSEPKVIKLDFILKLKIKRNDWLLADMCPQAANHCALF